MEDWKAVGIGFLLALGLRILDYVAPKGHHNKWLDKYAVKDEDDNDDKDKEPESDPA